MIKIACCDDDSSILDELHKYLAGYRKERGLVVDYVQFNSPLELIAEIERGARYDILFMDVMMPGENGIDTATEIRNYDRNLKIIFLTSSTEYAVQSYDVGAYYYQLKPLCEERLFKLMDDVLLQCEKERFSSLVMRCKNGITRIEVSGIEYCEVTHRTLLIHLTSGNVLESIGSLDELSRQLEVYGGFVRPHRSYLVNLEYVQSISYRAVTMVSKAEIPIPRGKYNELKNRFLEYAFQNRQVIL